MAPVKPMGIENPMKPGDARVGFPQKYNQEAPPAQDLNPDAVTANSVLPKPQKATVKAPRARKASKKR